MKKKTTFASVAEMVRETTDDDAFTAAFEGRLRGRRIVKELMVLRAGRGLSQGDVASKLGCTQSRISKLESSADADIRLGDFARYASAVGFRVDVVLESRETTSVERVKRLASRIKEELDHLAGLARDDRRIAQGVASFFNEAFFDLVKILQGSAENLPRDAEDGELPLSFEILEGGPRGEAGPPPAAPRESRRSSDQKGSKPRRRVVLPGRGDDGL